MAWEIPVTGERAGDGAAMYLCLLGYPDDEERRRETFEAVLAYRIRAWREHNRVTGRAVRGEVPDPRAQALLSRWPARDMWNTLELLNKQLLNRLRAAELLAFFGVVALVKPTRHRQIGRYRVAVRQPGTQMLTASEEGGIATMKLVDDPLMHMAIALRELFLVRRALALSTPGARKPDDDLLPRLLSCPQWVLPAVEDSQLVAQDWRANAISRPSWQSIDPKQFIELQPTVD